MIPLLHIGVALLSDISLGVTASMTLVGTTPHTYINASINILQDNVVGAANIATLMLFE